MIIDGHLHLYNDLVAEKIITSFTEQHRMEPTKSIGKGTVVDLNDKMQTAGIDYAVVANFAPVKGVNKVNEWTIEISKKNPNLIPLISVFPNMPISSIEEWFSKGAKGIKMHNGIQGFDPDDEGLLPIYKYCAANSIPITFHCGETSRVHLNDYTDISHIVPVIKKYPEIPFVLTHIAAGNPEDVLEIAENYHNVIFDTSITFSGEHCIHRIHNSIWEDNEACVDLFRTIGCNRIAFGSDYPFGNPQKDIERINNLSLSSDEKKQILGDNTYRLYQIKSL